MTRPTSSDALPEHVLDAGYAQLAEEFNGEAHRAQRRSAFESERAANVAEAASQVFPRAEIADDAVTFDAHEAGSGPSA